MSQQFEIRRLEVGETTKELTDFHVAYGETWRPPSGLKILPTTQRYFRISLKEPEQPVPELRECVERVFGMPPAPPEPQAEQVPCVDIVRHEVEQLRWAVRELRANLSSMQDERDRAIAERDKLAERVRELEKERDEMKSLAGSEVDAAYKMQCERDKLREELEQYKNSLRLQSEVAECQKAAIAELQSQLAAKAEPKAVQYAWRDARLEDAGSKWEARGRDGEFGEWRYGDRRITAYVPTDEYPWKTSIYGASAFSWKQCQVYAPVEAPAPQEEWRELKPGEQYSGQGQVKDTESTGWNDATIAACDNAGNLPFVARIGKNFYTTWRFARVKRGAE